MGTFLYPKKLTVGFDVSEVSVMSVGVVGIGMVLSRRVEVVTGIHTVVAGISFFVKL